MAVEKTKAPLFRGATKPAMMLGIPLTAFIIFTVPIFVVGMVLSFVIGQWGYLLFLLPVFLLPIMREVTKRDDQYLRLFVLNEREKMHLVKNRVNSVFVLPAKSIRNKE